MTFFPNYTKEITPRYATREQRNIFLAEFTRAYLGVQTSKILNIGSGGERFLAKQLPDRDIFDIDIQGDVDMKLDLEKVDKLDFEDASFDMVCALDLLEHVDSFHLILNEMIRVSRKHVLVSLPNPQNTFFELIFNRTLEQQGKSPSETGVYSKYYGLPLRKPEDRHRWHFTIDDVRRLFEHMQDHHKVSKISYFSSHEWNLKHRVVSTILPGRIYYNLFLPNIWIWLEK